MTMALTSSPKTYLYLVSSFDPAGPFFPDIPLGGHTVLMIDTATKGEGREVKQEDIDLFENQGSRVKIIDLFSQTQDSLNEALLWASFIWIKGGNTFYLLEAIQKTKFNEALKARTLHAPLVIVGESAGALVFGKDIAHAAFCDDPSQAPALASTQAMNWIDDLLVPHYKETKWGFGDKIDVWAAEQSDPSIYTFLDETAYIHITPTTRTLIGPPVILP
jgi:peptidase E